MTLYKLIDRECLKGEGIYLARYFQLVSNPVLYPVTPEAMAEIESRDGAVLVVFIPDKRGPVKIIRRFYGKDVGWYAVTNNYTTREPRPEKGWFLDLSTIPEATE